MIKYLTTHRRIALLNTGVILFVTLFALATPSVFKLLIEGVLPDSNFRSYILGAIVLLAITVGRSVLGVVQDYVFLLHRQLLEVAALKSALHRDDLKALNISETFAHIRNFVANFQYFWIQFAFYLAYAVFISGIVLCAFYLIEPVYCWLSLGFMLLHIANFGLFRPWVEGSARRFNDSKSGLIGEVSSHLKLLPEAKAAARETFFEDRMRVFSADYAASYLRKEFINFLQQLIQNGLINAFYIVFLCVALYISIQSNVSIGSAALCIFLASFLFEPIYRFSAIVKAYFEASNYSAWVPDQLRLPVPVAPVSGELRLEQVMTSVMAQRGMAPLNLVFAPGKLHLIKGPSGCGKSTLLDCIAGVEALASGRISIGDSARHSRSSLYYCEQNAAVFPGDLVQNLTFYDEAVHTATTEKLLQAIHLDPGQRALPQKAEALSGGQKQRLALARSLYCAGGILLFDEPTSALDADNEHAILRLLQEAARNKVIIMVSHSAVAEQYADSVYDMGVLAPA